MRNVQITNFENCILKNEMHSIIVEADKVLDVLYKYNCG